MRATYFYLRVGLITIALSLPIVLLIGGHVREGLSLRDSMSAYYHTSMRDIFVGALSASGVALYLYKGFRRLENILLNFAGGFLVLVAFLPTNCGDGTQCGRFTAASPHKLSAFLFFICIGFVCLLCASETLTLTPESKRARYRVAYGSIGVLLFVLPISAALLAWQAKHGTVLFWLEASGVWVFSLYWLVKSYELWRTQAEKRALYGTFARTERAVAEGAPPESVATGS